MQAHPERKKRTSTSGSRSKSKKSTNNIKTDQTVELKPKSYNIFYNQDICAKVKTQNSVSLNKNKPTRKTSKTIKRPQKQIDLQKKGNTKQSKEQSYLVSAQRKHSVNKITKTETTHLQSQDIYKKLYAIKKQLTKMKPPMQFSISEIEQYFNQIKQSFANISIQPLQSIFQKLHMMYITPIENFLNIIKPYESILRRKQQVSNMIKQQIQENLKLYQQLDPQDIQIIQLKEKIKRNTELIEEMKKKKKVEPGNFHMKKKKGMEQHDGHTSKAIVELSNRDSLISERINHNENKLVQEYQKPPAFQCQQKQQKNINAEKKKTQSFTAALQNLDEENHENVFLIENEENQNSESQIQQGNEGNDGHYESQMLEDEEERQQQEQVEDVQHKVSLKSAGTSFSFKLDLPRIDRTNPGFHDEFYAKLDEFSESWRNQALRQKRF